jgi:hypothetical protein
VAAGGGVSSSDALPLFDLLCTLLKVYNVGSANFIPLSTHMTKSSAYEDEDVPVGEDISTAVVFAVSSMLRAALGTGASGSSNTHGSRACTAALPYLVLLGRCCFACAVLAQYLQASQRTGGFDPSHPDITWFGC